MKSEALCMVLAWSEAGTTQLYTQTHLISDAMWDSIALVIHRAAYGHKQRE